MNSRATLEAMATAFAGEPGGSDRAALDAGGRELRGLAYRMGIAPIR